MWVERPKLHDLWPANRRPLAPKPRARLVLRSPRSGMRTAFFSLMALLLSSARTRPWSWFFARGVAAMVIAGAFCAGTALPAAAQVQFIVTNDDIPPLLTKSTTFH